MDNPHAQIEYQTMGFGTQKSSGVMQPVTKNSNLGEQRLRAFGVLEHMNLTLRLFADDTLFKAVVTTDKPIKFNILAPAF